MKIVRRPPMAAAGAASATPARWGTHERIKALTHHLHPHRNRDRQRRAHCYRLAFLCGGAPLPNFQRSRRAEYLPRK